MGSRSGNQQIVTFKAAKSLMAAMKGVPNRSQFIREAILAALDSTCPLCRGTGILTPQQKGHWDTFSASHAVQECQECHEFRLTCENEGSDDHAHR